MTIDPNYIVVYNTCPDQHIAERIAQTLVEKRLAAGVTVQPKGRSTYWWHGNIEQEDEFLLIIRTKAALFSLLEQRVVELHPYEVPELIAVPIVAGSESYLNWLDQSVESSLD